MINFNIKISCSVCANCEDVLEFANYMFAWGDLQVGGDKKEIIQNNT